MSYFAAVPVGAKFGRWSVRAHGGGRKWLCECDCGTVRAVDRGSLRSGTSTSCGCFRKEVASARATTHGHSKTRLYRVWAAMWDRCRNPDDASYQNYGARGISVCPAWSDFAEYKAHVDTLPLPEPRRGRLSLDRVNNDGNYEPGNLRWASDNTQARNTRQASRRVVYRGESVHPYTACKEIGLDKSSFKRRVLRGERPEDALRTLTRSKLYGRKRRSSLTVSAHGATAYVSEWARALGVNPGTLRYRLARSETPEDAIDYYVSKLKRTVAGAVGRLPRIPPPKPNLALTGGAKPVGIASPEPGSA